MTSSLFDTFGSQNFPSNPTVPPGPPPGYTAPSGIANPASKSPPLATAQISAAQSALQETNLQNVVQAVTGVVVPTSSSFDQLETWAQSLDNGAQNIENLVSSLLGIPTTAWDGVNAMLADVEDWAKQLDGGIQQLLTWWNSLVNGLLGGSGTNSVFDLTTWLQNAETQASNAWTQIEDFIATGNWSDLSAAWQDLMQAFLGTSTSTGLLGSIAGPTVTNVATQAQPVSNFPNSASVQPGGGWSWDGTVSYSGTGGSVRATPNGIHQLGLRGVVAPVQPDQTVVLSSQLQWSGLTYSGSNPIQLQLIPWNGSTPGTPVVVAEMASPASSGSWTALSGTYNVPSSGVTAVQMYLIVGQNATAGSVWWDNCTDTISGGYLATLEADLTALQADSTASTAALATFITAVESAISSFTNWTTYITAVESAWITYSTTESGLLSSAVFTLQNFFNTLLGVNTSTGQISATNVESSSSGPSLNDDLTTFWDWLTGSTTKPSGSAAVSASVTVTVGGVTDTVENHLQNAVDTLNNAQSGGGATGTTIASLGTNYTNIPATNVVGLTGGTVAFGAAGGGDAANFSGGTTASISWSHTIAAGDLGVLAVIAYEQPTGSTATSAVTYGGTAMTMERRETSSGTFGAVIEAWWLKSPPSLSQTVAVSLSGGNFNGVTGDSASYSASKLGTVGASSGGGSTSLSMSASSTTGNMVVGAFANTNGISASTLSAYSQTQRYNNGSTDIAFAMGDAAGAGSVAFAATSSGTAANIQWAGITVELEN